MPPFGVVYFVAYILLKISSLVIFRHKPKVLKNDKVRMYKSPFLRYNKANATSKERKK